MTHPKSGGTPQPAPGDPEIALAGSPEPCPACGGTGFRPLLSGWDRRFRTTDRRFVLIQCSGCRLMRLHPQPSPFELRDYYPVEWWPPVLQTPGERLEQAFRRYALGGRARFVERAVRESEESGLVLDVGCGDGLFLKILATRGVGPVVGIDFSLDACSQAWTRNRVPALCATLTHAPFAPESCAAITMFFVLERLYSPASYLDAARELLAPDGRLIVQIPNSNSWQFLLLGEHWSGLDIPRQLIHFRLSDLEILLDSCGFEILRRKHFSLHDNPVYLASSFAPGLDPAVRRCAKQPERPRTQLLRNVAHLAAIAVATPFTLLEAACHAGGTVIIEARRKS